MAPALTAPSWGGGASSSARLYCCWFWPSYFHLGKARTWGCHTALRVPSACFQPEVLQISTQFLPDLIPASSESRTLVPCTSHPPWLYAFCVPWVYTGLLLLPLQFWHLGGPSLISGAHCSLRAPPFVAEPTMGPHD